MLRSYNQAAIIRATKGLIDQGKSIWSIKHIKDLVMKESTISVSISMVRNVLREKFALSYRKVKRVPFSGNSERSKVLRSLYAQEMLKVY